MFDFCCVVLSKGCCNLQVTINFNVPYVEEKYLTCTETFEQRFNFKISNHNSDEPTLVLFQFYARNISSRSYQTNSMQVQSVLVANLVLLRRSASLLVIVGMFIPAPLSNYDSVHPAPSASGSFDSRRFFSSATALS